jgi:hypothetical protein
MMMRLFSATLYCFRLSDRPELKPTGRRRSWLSTPAVRAWPDIGMPGMDRYDVARRLRASSNAARASLVTQDAQQRKDAMVIELARLPERSHTGLRKGDRKLSVN